MNSEKSRKGSTADDQREALKRSEKAASQEQPGSFKDAETEHKKVEIGSELDEQPIKGIDPESDRSKASPKK